MEEREECVADGRGSFGTRFGSNKNKTEYDATVLLQANKREVTDLKEQNKRRAELKRKRGEFGHSRREKEGAQ